MIFIFPFDSIKFKIAKIRDVFPEPDSPTIPMLSPIFKSKLTFLIAFTWSIVFFKRPFLIGYHTSKSSTFKIESDLKFLLF